MLLVTARAQPVPPELRRHHAQPASVADISILAIALVSPVLLMGTVLRAQTVSSVSPLAEDAQEQPPPLVLLAIQVLTSTQATTLVLLVLLMLMGYLAPTVLSVLHLAEDAQALQQLSAVLAIPATTSGLSTALA